MSISGRKDDDRLELLARELFALFPNCHRCNEPIERYEDAEVLLLRSRLVHRSGCARSRGGDDVDEAESRD